MLCLHCCAKVWNIFTLEAHVKIFHIFAQQCSFCELPGITCTCVSYTMRCAGVYDFACDHMIFCIFWMSVSIHTCVFRFYKTSIETCGLELQWERKTVPGNQDHHCRSRSRSRSRFYFEKKCFRCICKKMLESWRKMRQFIAKRVPVISPPCKPEFVQHLRQKW